MLLPAVLSAFSILLGFAYPHLPQEGSGHDLSKVILKNLRRQGPDSLKGLRVEVRETLPTTSKEKPKLLSKATFSMLFPHFLRIEETLPGGGLRIYLWEGKKLLMGPGGGPFIAVEGAARHRILDRFQLLAALFCWDLLPPPPTSSRPKPSKLKLEDKTLHSSLNLGKSLPEIPVKRVYGLDHKLHRLAVGTKRYSTSGTLPGTRAFHPSLLRSSSGSLLKIEGWTSGLQFKPQFFRPRKSEPQQHALVQQGGEDQNFKIPNLKQLSAAFEVSVKDPGDWKSRAELLDKLGRQLFALGQEPAGLPLYGPEGKIRIQFVPSEGKQAKAPKGMKIRKLEKRAALVLYRRGPFAETMDSLERDLRKRAKDMGFKKTGSFLVIPTFFPDPAGPFPKPKTPMTLRGELLLEG